MSERPKKFEKKNVLYLVIAGLALVIIILLASWVIIANDSSATPAHQLVNTLGAKTTLLNTETTVLLIKLCQLLR
ncbi:hypothetical protein ACTL31_01905 [Leuconostoc mesenteroides]